MYYYFESHTPDGLVKQIVLPLDQKSVLTFPDIERNDGPERQQYLAWLAEGNTPEPWNPEPAPVDEAQPSTDAG